MNRFKSNPLLLKIESVPSYDTVEFCRKISGFLENSGRIASYFVYKQGNTLNGFVVIMLPDTDEYVVFRTEIKGKLVSMSYRFPQIYNFEREIFEQYPEAMENNNLKPLRFHKSLDGKKKAPVVGDMSFYEIDSHETHQVAVGPVHAGIIEPGHFRFNCYGEQILSLEISLGYQHRGIEKSLMGGPKKGSYYKIQALSGDSTIAHTICYVGNLESLSGVTADNNSALKRMIALELERLANHIGDLGGLAMDIGFLPTSSYCGRIRGDFLNMTADICGNRFGRGLLHFGGEKGDKLIFENILKKIDKAKPNLLGAVEMLWSTPSVMSRLENTGILPVNIAVELGVVGMPLRACGINKDIRKNLPFLNYNKYFEQISCDDLNGDVLARGVVRCREMLNSLNMISLMTADMTAEKLSADVPVPSVLSKNSVSISFSEGFRGEVCHTAITDEQGKFLRYKVVDPSFHNWNGLAYVVRNEGISDFPLCNKSFNLSYCGFDL